MSNKLAGGLKNSTPKTLRFHTFTNFHSKSDTSNGRTLHVGLFNAKDIVQIPNNGNVRGYLKLDSSGQEQAKTGIHAEIYKSLEQRPEDFHVLNGGITICAESIVERENDRKRISLKNPTIINGAQTRGVLKRFFMEHPDSEAMVKVELIINSNSEKEALFDDVSISRNQQNSVRILSIAGKRGMLEDLDQATMEALKKDESQKDKWDTEKLIQLIFAIMPQEVVNKVFPKKDYKDKSYAYSSKGTMFKKFMEINSGPKDGEDYKFFLDIAQDTIDLYADLRSNKHLITGILDQGNFIKQGYKISKDKKSVTILDGVIFPILGALSLFVKKVDNKYSISHVDKKLIHEIVKEIMTSSNVKEHGNVQTLGKSSISYINPYRWFQREINNNL